jgi:uncharacterized damage-inducible protein DinB
MTSFTTFPEPPWDIADPGELLMRYLDFYRAELARRVEALNDDELRRTRLPSAWSPLELLSHLVHMEQRWIVWGFLGQQVDAPWGDRPEGRWQVADGMDRASLLRRLNSAGAVTNQVLRTTSLDALATPGGRFEDGATPTLSWICFHVLQEYARHLGHLDIAVELAGGPRGAGP